MESLDLKRFNLTIEESRDIINFIAQERGISTEKLLSTIKPNLKRKNNKILTTKTQRKAAKTQQKAAKTQQKAAKTQQKAAKIHQKEAKIHQKAAKINLKAGRTHEKIKTPT